MGKNQTQIILRGDLQQLVEKNEIRQLTTNNNTYKIARERQIQIVDESINALKLPSILSDINTIEYL